MNMKDVFKIMFGVVCVIVVACLIFVFTGCSKTETAITQTKVEALNKQDTVIVTVDMGRSTAVMCYVDTQDIRSYSSDYQMFLFGHGSVFYSDGTIEPVNLIAKVVRHSWVAIQFYQGLKVVKTSYYQANLDTNNLK